MIFRRADSFYGSTLVVDREELKLAIAGMKKEIKSYSDLDFDDFDIAGQVQKTIDEWFPLSIVESTSHSNSYVSGKTNQTYGCSENTVGSSNSPSVEEKRRHLRSPLEK